MSEDLAGSDLAPLLTSKLNVHPIGVLLPDVEQVAEWSTGSQAVEECVGNNPIEHDVRHATTLTVCSWTRGNAWTVVAGWIRRRMWVAGSLARN